ncbi:hypothetical protein ABZ502_34195 [Streptomyces abikoensis]|uniref:hypothetical protein n=1 Tax=Streptomyces abikoensis TaxID=97398 RepID=UPI0033D2AB68
MSTHELRTRVLEQGLAALHRTEIERQYLDPDYVLLSQASMSSSLAGVSLRLLDALSRHRPDLAHSIADELFDLQDDPAEMADYLRSQAGAAGVDFPTAAA